MGRIGRRGIPNIFKAHWNNTDDGTRPPHHCSSVAAAPTGRTRPGGGANRVRSYLIPDRPWSFYVTEGQPHGQDYTFFGFLLASENEDDWRWSTKQLSSLERIVAGRVVRDETFTPGRLTDVVILPL